MAAVSTDFFLFRFIGDELRFCVCLFGGISLFKKDNSQRFQVVIIQHVSPSITPEREI